jgi:hypothetical protein
MRSLCAADLALVAVILSAATDPPRAAAQSQEIPAARLTFEVASVRPSNPATLNSFSRMDPSGRYRAENITVRNLISSAYGHKLFQVSGGPDWIDTARYDIVAKSEESLMNQLLVRSGQLIAHGVTLSQFAGHLPNFVDRDVIDKTGLTELYDIKLECTSERAQMTSHDAAVSASAPSIFVALRQLGLKLEPEKAPGEVLVVDNLERPSQN